MDFRSVAMGLAFAVIWASAFSAGRIVSTALPPLTALVIRFAISGALGMGLAAMLGQRVGFTRAEWRRLVVFGLCQNALYLGLNWVAMQWIEASLASIIGSTMPLMVALAGWLAGAERLRARAWIGLALGFSGAALIMAWRMQGGVSLPGVVLCVIAAVALTAATLSVRGASSGRNVFMAVSVQMLVGAAALALPALLLEGGRPLQADAHVIAAMAFTILLPGLGATWLWFLLVARVGAVRAATFHFLSPFLGVTIAALYLGEPFGWHDIVGALVIAAGIFLVQTSRMPPERLA